MTRPGAFALPRPRRRRSEGSVVPMINIVFLLLVFFLLTATVAPPEPFAVTPPVAQGEGRVSDGGPLLHVGADGRLAYGPARGDAALAAVTELPAGAVLTVQADAGLDGAAFAALLARLSAAGVEAVSVVVRAP